MEAEVSIIIPVYNAANYLQDCIHSILKQTNKNFEILLVDDGSTDGSGKICDEFQRQYNCITVIHQENGGVSKARNTGIINASGDYLTFVDADDWLEPDCIDVLISIMLPGGMAVANVVTSNISSEINSNDQLSLNKETAILSSLSHNGIKGYPVGKLYDADLIRRNHIMFDPEIRIREDMHFVIQYITYTTQPIIWKRKGIYNYRTNPAGTLKKRFIKSDNFDIGILTEIMAVDRSMRYVKDNPMLLKALSLVKAKVCATVLRAMLAGGYKDKNVYKKLLRYERKRCIQFLFARIGAKSAKVSVCLSCLSPKLEYFIWKCMNKC